MQAQNINYIPIQNATNAFKNELGVFLMSKEMGLDRDQAQRVMDAFMKNTQSGFQFKNMEDIDDLCRDYLVKDN